MAKLISILLTAATLTVTMPAATMTPTTDAVVTKARLCLNSDSRDPAMPADVRKRSALPFEFVMNPGSALTNGHSPKTQVRTCRKAKGLPHIGRHSRGRLFGQSSQAQTQQTQQIKVGEIEFFGVGDISRETAGSRKPTGGGRRRTGAGKRQTAVGTRQTGAGRRQEGGKNYTRERLERLRRALPVKEGDQLSFETIEAARDSIERSITRSTGKPPTDVSPLCCDDRGELVFFIGLPGPAYRPFRYNPTPRVPKNRLRPPAMLRPSPQPSPRGRGRERADGTNKSSNPPAMLRPSPQPSTRGRGTEKAGVSDKSSNPTLPAEIVGLSQQVDELTGEAVRIEPGEDRSKGYALSLYPPLRAVQMRIRTFAIEHEALLIQVLSMSVDAKQRRAAAHVLGYAVETDRQIKALAMAARDSDAGVRNEATRALGVLAQASATAAQRIPFEGFVLMLSSGKWLDRNKSAFLLSILSAKRDPALLRDLRERALESLIEMARWRDTSHANSARVILGRVAGIEETRLQKLASEGPVEEIINAVSRKQR